MALGSTTPPPPVREACVRCDTRIPPSLESSCPRCGGILEVVGGSDGWAPDRPIRRLEDLRAVLPLPDDVPTLGEAGTPLLALTRSSPGDAVLGKAEWCNPTGSFKDRGAAVGVAWARALGARRILAASTGNNAAAVAAYAARAGLACVAVVPVGTPMGKLGQSLAAGAEVLEVEGTFSECHAVAVRLADEEPSWANLTSTYANPWMTEAHKSIAYELVADLGSPPGSVVVPIGAGPMLAGILKGFEELRSAGAVPRVPVPVGVQAAGCAPIARAFDLGATEVEAWEDPVATVAGSIGDPLVGYADHGTRTLALIRRHEGLAVAVDDDEITAAARTLGHRDGVVCEPAAAATLAALRARPDLPRPVVLVLSGHGLKDGRRLSEANPARRRRIAPDVPATEALELLAR